MTSRKGLQEWWEEAMATAFLRSSGFSFFVCVLLRSLVATDRYHLLPVARFDVIDVYTHNRAMHLYIHTHTHYMVLLYVCVCLN